MSADHYSMKYLIAFICHHVAVDTIRYKHQQHGLIYTGHQNQTTIHLVQVMQTLAFSLLIKNNKYKQTRISLEWRML